MNLSLLASISVNLLALPTAYVSPNLKSSRNSIDYGEFPTFRTSIGGENIPSKDGFGNTLGNEGDGFAKITFIESNNENNSSEYTIKLKTNIGTILNDTLTNPIPQ